jgi:lipoprotein NlpI
MKRFCGLISLVLLGFVTLWVGCQSPALTGAKVYIQQQDWDNAREQLEIAVQQEPGNAEAHYLLGRAYGEQGDYEAMVRAFQTSLEISERWKADIESVRDEKWVVVFNRGVQAGREENFQKAAEEFEIATIIDPENPDAFNNLGFAYTSLDRLDQALEAYGRVFELQPESQGAFPGSPGDRAWEQEWPDHVRSGPGAIGPGAASRTSGYQHKGGFPPGS